MITAALGLGSPQRQPDQGGDGWERGVRIENKGKENRFSTCSVSSANLYPCTTSVSAAIKKILVGLSWFSCEIVLVIFKLINCLSNLTLSPVFSPSCTDNVFGLPSLFIYRLKT